MISRFQLEKNNTSVSVEIIAGISSFLAISYILAVNPIILSDAGMPVEALYAATAVAAGLCTIFLGLYANLPFTMAPAMSLNGFFVHTMCVVFGFKWQEALCITFISGLMHAAVIASPARRRLITNCLPLSLKYAASVGLGMFVTVGGIRYSGLLTEAGASSDNVAFTVSSRIDMLPPIIGRFSYSHVVVIFGVLLMVALLALEKKNRVSYAAIPIGVIAATFVGIPMGVTVLPAFFSGITATFSDAGRIFCAFFGDPGLLSLLDSPATFAAGIVLAVFVTISGVFDSVITTLGAGTIAGNPVFSAEELDDFHHRPSGGKNRFDRVLVANSLGASVAALFGSSPVIVYIESSIGAATKGRTGLTAVVAGLLFLASLPLARFVHILPAEAVGAALILAGAYLLTNVGKVNWNDIDEAIPSGLAILIMIATSNFTAGLCLGASAHVVMQVMQGNGKKLHPLQITACMLLLAATIYLYLVKY